MKNSNLLAQERGSHPRASFDKFLLLTVCSAFWAAAITGPALAQDTEAEDQPAAAEEAAAEEADVVVVTGSRIARPELEATSPMVTVDEGFFDAAGSMAVEAQLNKLPQFAPTLDVQYDAGDIQPTSTETPGTASIALRGLGANRTLTLIDGRRTTPANALGSFDINALPGAAIERVEIITGGASAAYGADAVAGVVNFILKDDYEGVDFDSQYSITEVGDGEEFRVSVLTGANFDGGRGNVMFGGEYYNRQTAFRRNRDAFTDFWSDPNTLGVEFFVPFPMYQINGAFDGFPDTAAIVDIFDQTPPFPLPGSILPFFGDIAAFPTANPADATLFTGIGLFNGVNPSGAYRFPGVIDGLEFFTQFNGAIGKNYLRELASLPLDRWTMFGRGKYDLNENITYYLQGYFARSSARTVQQPSPAANQWGTLMPYGDDIYAGNPDLGIPHTLTDPLNPASATHPDYLLGGQYGLDCPAFGGCTESQVFPVPDELAHILDSRTAFGFGVGPSTANNPWRLGTYLEDILGDRIATTDNFTFQLLTGFEGKIPTLDWIYEVYASHGQTRVNTLITGVASLERHRAVMTAPNYGQGFSFTGNATQGGFGAATATCTSGLNPFDLIPTSKDCKEAVAAHLRNTSDITQTIVEGTVTGGLFDLPAGKLRFAAGADYRRLAFEYLNDTLTTQGRSFLDQAIGIFPSGNSAGDVEVSEGYAEVLIPVLSNLPLIQQFNVEAGARYSSYNTTGADWTYKFLGDWDVTEYLRFRGGYNRATRSPNIGELFLAPQQLFAVAAAGDICSVNNPQSYSANPATNPDAASVRALCETLMTPAGAFAFYANAANQSAGIAFVFSNQVGNSDLTPEQADTWTVGAVVNSTAKNPWLSRLRLSVDYYNIDIKDAIGLQTADLVMRLCFDGQFNPAYDPNTPACQANRRDPVQGTISLIDGTFTNDTHLKTSGIDIVANWGVDFAEAEVGIPGAFNLNVNVNYLLTMEATELEGEPLTDYVGTLGPAGEAGVNANAAYQWRMFTAATYSIGDATIGMQWIHLPETDSINAALNPATTLAGAPTYDLFNLNASYAITSAVIVRAGIDNLTDVDPPYVEFDTSPPPGVATGGNINTFGVYDVLGRRYYVGLGVKF